MRRLIWLPLEYLSQRYTNMTADIYRRDFERYLPNFELIELRVDAFDQEIRTGSFLDCFGTVSVKSKQLELLAMMFNNDQVNAGDVIFIDDLQFPIEWIRYMEKMSQRGPIYICGVQHAGSYIKTDEISVRMPDSFSSIEDGWLRMCDAVFVGSSYHRRLIYEAFSHFDSVLRIYSTGLPFDPDWVQGIWGDMALKILIPSFDARPNVIVFPHRLHPDKCPENMEEVSNILNNEHGLEHEVVYTQKENLTKETYYNLLANSKIVFASSKQENFGYAVLEGCALGCVPVLNNDCSYPEMYPHDLCYKSLSEAAQIITRVLTTPQSCYDVACRQKDNVKKMCNVINNFNKGEL